MRQEMMAQNSDAFLVLPGGYGTLDEALEIITWRQMGFINKPIAFYNVQGFFNGLLDFF